MRRNCVRRHGTYQKYGSNAYACGHRVRLQQTNSCFMLSIIVCFLRKGKVCNLLPPEFSTMPLSATDIRCMQQANLLNELATRGLSSSGRKSALVALSLSRTKKGGRVSRSQHNLLRCCSFRRRCNVADNSCPQGSAESCGHGPDILPRRSHDVDRGCGLC